jgi:hypothetical protein
MSPATETLLLVCREWRPPYKKHPAVQDCCVQLKQQFHGLKDVSVSAVTLVRPQEQLCCSDRIASHYVINNAQVVGFIA